MSKIAVNPCPATNAISASKSSLPLSKIGWRLTAASTPARTIVTMERSTTCVVVLMPRVTMVLKKMGDVPKITAESTENSTPLSFIARVSFTDSPR